MSLAERNNFVTPLGEFYVGSKYAFFGNRGPLHKDNRVVRPWVNKRWLVCVTDGLGPPETFMASGHHTELFFLDEATALAAGQRPCFQCRRLDFNRFIDLFDGVRPLTSPRAPAMDEILHAERVDPNGDRVLFHAEAAALPDGVFVMINGEPWLLARRAIHCWSPQGYLIHADQPVGVVEVLTPRCTVEVISAGYQPQIDDSAFST